MFAFVVLDLVSSIPSQLTFSALMLLEGHPACKKWGMLEVGADSPDGVAPS